jgi:hypothetical protein
MNEFLQRLRERKLTEMVSESFSGIRTAVRANVRRPERESGPVSDEARVPLPAEASR